MTRRQAIRFLLGATATAGMLGTLPGQALAVSQSDVDKTNSDLSSAQAQLDKVQKQLDSIGDEYQALSEKQSDTLDQIESVNDQIDQTQANIDAKQKELDEKKERLSKRVSSAYKSGGVDILSVLLNSSSLQELDSNIYYLDKVSEADSQMIADVKSAKAELDQQKADLQSQKSELESLNETQKAQLKQMQEKQQEVQDVIDGLSSQVKQLMDKRDSELAAMADEKAKQEAAAKAAAAAAAKSKGSSSSSSSSSSSGSAASGVSGSTSDGTTTGSQAKVIAACKSTPSPGAGLCAMWVSQVFNNAGYGYASGNACDMYNAWCTSSNLSNLKPGMIVAVSSHPHTSAGRIYGHIGIYVGGGNLMDNIGYIRTININSWINYYGATVTPRWGWLMGIKLS